MMMRILRYVAYALAGLLLLAGAGVVWLVQKQPASRPPSSEKVEPTPERVERGRYLFEHVAACSSCHSERDFSQFGGPVKAGRTGSGMCLPEAFKMPGRVCAPNLTPYPEAGVGAWTDGELLRAIREGVGRDGRALFMMSNYPLGDEDARSVVAYLRSLPPLDSRVPPSELIFPVKLGVKFSPKPLEGPLTAPAPTDTVAHGKYLAELASCEMCHSGAAGPFAGGHVFETPSGQAVAVNITSDPTGLGKTTREEFILRFKAYAEVEPGPASNGKEQMPWLHFAGMTEQDLGALYDYLQTVKPIAYRPPRPERQASASAP
jgi:mono/diheme cytochrome c family protein